MNNIHKYKTSFIAKATTLASLLIFLSIGTAWGQTTINMTSNTNNRSTAMTCGTTYTLTLSDQNDNRTYTFTNPNGAIKINSFYFDAIYRDGQGISEGDGYDYLKITYGEVILEYGNESYGWGSACHSNNWYVGSYTYYSKTVEVPEIMIPQGDTVTFSFVSGADYSSGGDCKRASFQAILTPICCPTLTAPADGATYTTDNDVTFRWNSITSVQSPQYKLVLSKLGGSPTNYVISNATNYTVNDLSDGVYTWTVGLDGDEQYCETRTFSVCNGDVSCVDPQSLVPRYNTIDTLRSRLASWDPVPCATRYTIYIAPESVGRDNLLTSQVTKKYTTSATEYMLPIMDEGIYLWTVVPENAQGEKPTKCGIYRFCVKYVSASNVAASPSTQGTDFFFSLMQNGYKGNNTSNDTYTAIIAPKETGTVKFHYYANGTTVEHDVTKDVTLPVTLAENLVYHDDPTSEAQRNRTVHVTSDVEISLYIANEADNSFDASIVLPTHALGNDYMIQTFPSNTNQGEEGRPCFMIIATEDDTPISISGAHSGDITPAATSFTLNKGQSYFVMSNGDNKNDLSGLRISVTPRNGYSSDSCKTIAVFNGNVVTCVPNTVGNNRDHLVEQAYPITNWGKKFAITSTDGYINSTESLDVDYIHITAAESNTGITIYQTDNSGNITTTTTTIATAGGTKEFTLHRSKGSCYIETTKPVACYLYQRSSKQIRINNSTNNDKMGDPSMVWMSPIERGIEQITFSTFDADGIERDDHWVNIVIPTEALSTTDPTKFVKLDGTNISGSFAPLSGNPDYMYARRKINHGTHTLVSEGKGKMVVHVYGLGDVRGYAYTAGSAAVPFRSSVSLAAGDGPALDVETLPADYHFCGGTIYRFSVNNNASTDIDSVRFNFDDGNGWQKLITPTVKSFEYSLDPGDYNITALVYFTIYNELCQKQRVVDTIRDKVLLFVTPEENITATVCKGTPYKFERKYWKPGNNGNLVEDKFSYTSDAVDGPIEDSVYGKSEYGCDLKIRFHLNVYPDVVAGSIAKEEVDCPKSPLSITKLINVTYASGGDPSAHYQWQRSDSESGPWTDVEGQTGDSYTVTQPGYYRRAYLSEDCEAECYKGYTDYVYVAQAGSFNPGTHIDGTEEICHGSTLADARILGGDMENSSILCDADGYYTTINGNRVDVPMQWQYNTDESQNANSWFNISGATGYNYTIPANQTFTQTTYYRRIITGVGDCGLEMNMGVFGVIVKPDFTPTHTEKAGCYGENNAVVNYTIAGGSGNFTVTYTGPTSGTAVLEGGVYKCLPLQQGREYTFTIYDNVYNCTKTQTITTPSPSEIQISSITAIEVCEGILIQIPIPAIQGGVQPYTMQITSSGLKMPAAGYTINNISPNSATIYNYQLPQDVASSSQTYTVTYKVTDAEGCTDYEGYDVVKVKAIPVFTTEPSNVKSCKNPDGTILATITNTDDYAATTTYDYYINNILKGDNQGVSYTFTELAQGTHTVKVTASNGCSATKEETIDDDLTLTITTSVSGAISSGSNSYYTCPDKSITVGVETINGNTIAGVASNYEYSFNNNTSYGSTYSYNTTTSMECNTYLEIPIYVREIASGCVDNQNVVISIEDGQNPTINTDPANPINIDATTYFCPTFFVPDVTEQVRALTSDNCGISTITQMPVADTEADVADGKMVITITVTDLCGNKTTTTVNVQPVPWDNFEITADKYPNCYCHGDNITLSTRLFEVADADDNAKITYEWYKVTNPGASETLSDPLDKNTAKYSGEGKHELIINSATEADGGTYRVVISDPNGCTRSADVEICVHQAIEFHLE